MGAEEASGARRLTLAPRRTPQAASTQAESAQAVRALFYETLNRLRQEEKKVKAEAWMFDEQRHSLPDN